jgi:hypothetical protein
LALAPAAAFVVRRRPVAAVGLLLLWAVVAGLVLYGIGRYGECFESTCPGIDDYRTATAVVASVACGAALAVVAWALASRRR